MAPGDAELRVPDVFLLLENLLEFSFRGEAPVWMIMLSTQVGTGQLCGFGELPDIAVL